ncbi:MAG: lysine--tRNA ligase [Sphaerochaetaceae bacterium]|nr:lysine--tRNA ligase [Sphaerochaetaceae bacterium]
MEQSVHWADIYADKIIREKGPKDLYTCASGITPSGTVHIGNFREIISVDLVVRALRRKGCNVRFIYSWDNYDVFRKVPKNMPEQEKLATYLRKPITLVPDTTGRAENYARGNEKDVEEKLPLVGIQPEYLYQAQRYRSSLYADQMKMALEHKSEIIAILNQYRTEPLDDSWWPIAVFSSFTDKDNTTVLSWDGEYGITYRDNDLNKTETIDLRTTPYTKLHWRIDWPMRWVYEGVDFEPAGKDHHSQGGSFDTSKQVVELFGGHAPVSFQYDFISIKGRGGKISSSSGEVVSLGDVLEVYTPEITRYMFASTRPNTEFAISFDLDVLKIYEDYDNCERRYFGLLPVNDKKREMERRVYELSQVGEVPSSPGYQVPFRHLCNLLQINGGDIDAVISSFSDIKEDQVERLRTRCRCAWAWITQFSPEDFRFALATDSSEIISLTDIEKKGVEALCKKVTEWDGEDEKDLSQRIYDSAEEAGIAPTELFPAVYRVLIGKERGPKLALFIKTVGKDRICKILSRY